MKDYIGLAYQFFNLTREAINEMEKQGNKSLIFSDLEHDDEKSWKAYEENTKWNDFNIGVPVLFNFYHGLELLMKGLHQELYPGDKITNHNLTSLLAKLKRKIPEIPEALIQLLSFHISNQSPFNQFFVSNKLGVDRFYILLKYPESTKGQEFLFKEIHGNEQLGLTKFTEIRKSTVALKDEIINWKTSKTNAQQT